MTLRLEHGALGTLSQIPLCVPHLKAREWEYVKQALDTNFISSVGPFVERFERELARAVGTAHAVATVNGTAALHIALLVAGVQPGDEVLLPSLTFVAPANAVRYVGAWPVFLDVEPDYWQLDVEQLRAFIEVECQVTAGVLRNRRTGRRIAAILPVDMLGHPCEMQAIGEIAGRYGIAVVEDATESLGATDAGHPVGSLAPIACFSFNGNKIITTGGGGMIVTDNEAWARKAKYLTTQAKDDPLEHLHNEIGYNYRLTNLLAALGCAQLEQLVSFVDHKRRIAATYAETLASVPGIRLMRERSDARSIFWMYTILVDETAFGMDSRALLRELSAKSIQTRPLWCPLHRLQPYRDAQAWNISVAERLYADALSLPCSVGLTLEEARYVAGCIASIRGQHHP
jgi:perosamine synthetase